MTSKKVNNRSKNSRPTVASSATHQSDQEREQGQERPRELFRLKKRTMQAAPVFPKDTEEFLFASRKMDPPSVPDRSPENIDKDSEDDDFRQRGGFWSASSAAILAAAPDAEWAWDSTSISASSVSSARSATVSVAEEGEGEESWILPSLLVEGPVPRWTRSSDIEEHARLESAVEDSEAISSSSRAAVARADVEKPKKKSKKSDATRAGAFEAQRKAQAESSRRARVAELKPWLKTFGIDASDPAYYDPKFGTDDQFEPGFMEHCRNSFIQRDQGYSVHPDDEWNEMPVGCRMVSRADSKPAGFEDRGEGARKSKKRKSRRKKGGVSEAQKALHMAKL